VSHKQPQACRPHFIPSSLLISNQNAPSVKWALKLPPALREFKEGSNKLIIQRVPQQLKAPLAVRLLFTFRIKPHKSSSDWEQLLGWLVCEATSQHVAEKVESAHNHRTPCCHMHVHTAAQRQTKGKKKGEDPLLHFCTVTCQNSSDKH